MADHGYLPEYDENFDREENERGFMLGDRGRFREGHAAHPDAHYLSWRDRHMRELDRDYEEYRREREQQFHSDFSAWRHRRHGNPEPLRTGMAQTGLSQDPGGVLQLENEVSSPAESEADPMAAATLRTTSGGRGR